VFVHLRAKSEGVVGLEVGVAGPKGRTGALVESIRIRVGASTLEVIVELDSFRRAGLGSVVASRAAVGRILCRNY
jgi:hypothetical protein